MPGRFKDYHCHAQDQPFTSPCTPPVIGPFGGNPWKFQIRTEEMHRLAEEGIAAPLVLQRGQGRRGAL